MRLSASGAHFATTTGPNPQPHPSLKGSLLLTLPTTAWTHTPVHTHLHPKEETPDSRLQLQDAKI